MKDLCNEAKLLAATFLNTNDNLTKEITDIVSEINTIENLYSSQAMGKMVSKKVGALHTQLDTLMKSSLLIHTKEGKDSIAKLVRNIKDSHRTVGKAMELVNSIDELDYDGMEAMAKIIFDGDSIQEGLEKTKKALADYIGSKLTFAEKKGLTTKKRDIIKTEKKIKQADQPLFDLEPIVKKEVKEIEKAIKEGENPTLVKFDADWEKIRGLAKDKKDEIAKYKSYALASIFFGEDEDIFKAFTKHLDAGNITNTKLTKERLESIDDLSVLMHEIQMNIGDVANDESLRALARDKVLQLSTITKGDNAMHYQKMVTSLRNLSDFLDHGKQFSDIVKFTAMVDYAKKTFGIATHSDKALAEEIFSALDSIAESGKRKVVIAGKELTDVDLLKILGSMMRDDSFERLVRYSTAIGEGVSDYIQDIKEVFSMRGVSEKVVDWASNLIKNTDFSLTVKDTNSLIMKTITGREIPAEVWNTPGSIAFFDVRKLKYNGVPEDSMYRGALYDMKANRNRLNIIDRGQFNTIDRLEDISEHELKYIIVNDNNWLASEEFLDRINKVNAERAGRGEDKIQIIYPRVMLKGNFNIDKAGNLIFRTPNDKFYKEVLNELSIDTMYSADLVRSGEDITREDIENAFLDYYKQMIGKNGITREQLIEHLYLDTGLKLDKDFDPIKADKLLRNNLDVTGRYTYEVINVVDEVQKINSLSKVELEEAVREVFGIKTQFSLAGDENSYKQLLIKIRTAQTAEDLLLARGEALAYINGGELNNINIKDLSEIIVTDGYTDILRKKIFGDSYIQKIEKMPADMKKAFDYQNKIASGYADQILDTLTIQFTENIIKNGYELPLISPRKSILKHLSGADFLDDDFIQSFLKLNKLPNDLNQARDIIGNFIGDNVKISKPRISNVDYSSQYMRIIKDTGDIEALNGLSVVAGAIGYDKALLGQVDHNDWVKGILDKYEQEADALLKKYDGTVPFNIAQQLKQKYSFALDVFEQQILLPRYNNMLRGDKRAILLGAKFELPLLHSTADFQQFKNLNKQVLSKINNGIQDAGAEVGRLLKEFSDNPNELAKKGYVIMEINGNKVMLNLEEAFQYSIETMPTNVKGLSLLKGLSKDMVAGMPKERIHLLVKYIEYLKTIDAKGNLAVRTLYRMNPILAKANFFSEYVLNSNGVPKILSENLFENIDDFTDTLIKNNIVAKIGKTFNKGVELTDDVIDNIIDEAFAIAKDNDIVFKNLSSEEVDTMKKVYNKQFDLYKELTNIPDSAANELNKFLGSTGKEILEGLEASVKGDADAEELLEELKNLEIDFFDGSSMKVVDALGRDIRGRVPNMFGDMKVTIPTKNIGDEYIKQSVESALSLTREVREVSRAERELTSSILNNTRQLLKRSTLTNMISDVDSSLAGINTRGADLLSSATLGIFKTISDLGSNTVTTEGWLDKLAMNIKSGISRKSRDEDALKRVQAYYNNYYVMSISDLAKVNIGEGGKEAQAALTLAIYFKRLEIGLGSIDGAIGVSTNRELNKAFGNIGTVFNNIHTKDQLLGFIRAVRDNQIFKFLGYAKKGDVAYFKPIADEVRKAVADGGRYIKYFDLDVNTFNKLFNSNFTDNEFKVMFQALSGTTLSTGQWWKRIPQNVVDYFTAAGFISRAFQSYPFQLFTSPVQSIGYEFKKQGLQKSLGIEDMAKVDAIRKQYGLLDGYASELHPVESVKKFLGILDEAENKAGDITQEIADMGVSALENPALLQLKANGQQLNIFSRLNGGDLGNFVRLFDNVKDNANNFVDAFYAKAFKNLAFVRAIQTNGYINFTNAEEFAKYMAREDISIEAKKKILDAISANTTRQFNDMIGSGFTGLDKAIGANTLQSAFVNIMNLMNFRGAWGQNVFKQTTQKAFTTLKTLFYLAKGDKELYKEGIEIITKSPEFLNLYQSLFREFASSMKLTRFTDDGRQDEDNDGVIEFMDVLNNTFDTWLATSQTVQGLMSFAPFRVVGGALRSSYLTNSGRAGYDDPIGLGALLHGAMSNVSRQFKSELFVARLTRAFMQGGPETAMEFVANEWMNLSQGAMKFALLDVYNNGVYQYDNLADRRGVEKLLIGDTEDDTERSYMLGAFKYNQVWNDIKNTFVGDENGERLDYFRDGLSTLFNASYAGRAMKEFIYGSVQGGAKLIGNEELADEFGFKKTYIDTKDMDLIKDTSIGKAMTTGRPVPIETSADAEIFINEYTNQNAPGGKYALTAIDNFLKYGSVDGNNKLYKNNIDVNELYKFLGKESLERIVKGVSDIAQKGTDEQNRTLIELAKIEIDKKVADGGVNDPLYKKYHSVLELGAHAMMFNKAKDSWMEMLNQETGVIPIGKKKPDKNTVLSSGEFRKGTEQFEKFRLAFAQLNADVWQKADMNRSMSVGLKMVFNKYKETNPEFLDTIFHMEEAKDVEGTIIQSPSFRPEALRQIHQEARFNQAIEDRDMDAAKASLSTITSRAKEVDEDGVAQLIAVNNAMEVINKSGLSSEEKFALNTELFLNNQEVFTLEKAKEKLSDEVYNVYGNAVMDIIHKIDESSIENAIAVTPENIELKKTKGKGGSGGGGSSYPSTKVKDILGKMRSEGFKPIPLPDVKMPLPVVIRGSNLIDSQAKNEQRAEVLRRTFEGYKPKTNLSPKKDVNRKEKLPKKKAPKKRKTK